MATLALPPTGAATQPAQVDPNASEKPSADGSAADPSGIDPGWVVLGKSDVVPAELAAAAAAAGHRRLGFSPLPMIPIWVRMVLGGVVYTAVPFYKRVRRVEGEAIENVETALEIVEHAAEMTEKLAANVANSLPENGSLHKVAEEVEYIAEEVDKDAHKVEVIIKKVILLTGQWLRAWANLQKPDQKESMLDGSIRLEIMAKQILYAHGWRFSQRICNE